MTNREIEILAEKIAEKLIEKQKPKDRLVTVKEASEITGLAVNSLYNRKALIGYVKRGQKLMFSTENLEAYNRSREY